MEEENITFSTAKTVFYNPAMRFCRSMSSLAVGAIGEKLEVVDAFTASGIRGIRYAKENKNVRKVTFIDIDKRAIALAKKNAKTNKLGSKASAVIANVSRAAFDHDADFLEIDPFGTPSPYLVDAFRYFNTKKTAYLSVTATDVAVLCGGKTAACMKNYHSKPMNNEFTHETGLRIMLKKMAETAAEFNMGMEPLASFSDRHYLKSIVMVKRSADLAFDSMKKLGHVSFCKKCGFRFQSRFPEQRCFHCSSDMDFAGLLWTGGLHDGAFLKRMAALNETRAYADRDEIAGMLALMGGELGMPPYFYDVHAMCKAMQAGSVPKMDVVLKRLHDSGHRAVRTHFTPVGIKTDAPFSAVSEAMAWKG